MRILFISHYFSPHIGGVEKHVYEISRELILQGHEVTVITEKHDSKLKDAEVFNGVKVIRFNYPKKKIIGLFYVWKFLWKKHTLIWESDVIHIHDVFVWYFPFKFLFFWKKIYVTIHGYEGNNPFSFGSVLQKKLAIRLSNGSIGVGKYLEKYIKAQFTLLIYGAVRVNSKSQIPNPKIENSIVFVGRLSKDTGVLKLLEYLKTHKDLKASFVGDGQLRNECEKYGKVYGFTDPQKFLKNAEYVVPGGYLACLEAFSYKCKVKVFWNNKLKEDYWKLSPMYKFTKREDLDEAYKFVLENSWKDLTNKYLSLWNT